MKNPYQQYRDESVMTATPGEIVVKLFTAVIKNVNLASAAIEQNRVSDAHSSLLRAQEIILELSLGLDMQFAVSSQIKPLYDFIYEKLVDANLKKDASILETVMPLLNDFRATWQEADRLRRVQEAASSRVQAPMAAAAY